MSQIGPKEKQICHDFSRRSDMNLILVKGSCKSSTKDGCKSFEYNSSLYDSIHWKICKYNSLVFNIYHVLKKKLKLEKLTEKKADEDINQLFRLIRRVVQSSTL